MANPKLIALSPDQPEKEYEISGGVSIGRATDNNICLAGETVSRYHAIIEERGGAFWLSDLGSATGTTVNGVPIISERRLLDGDVISFGGAVSLRYLANLTNHSAAAPANRAARDEAASGTQIMPEPVSTRSSPVILESVSTGSPERPLAPASEGSHQGLSVAQIAAAVAVGLVLVGVIALIVIQFLPGEKRSSQGGGGCSGVSIVNPASGATVSEPVTVKVKANRPQCVKGLRYKIDSYEFANLSADFFEVTLDPAGLKNRFPALEDGNHELSIAVENESGQLQESVDAVRLNLVFSAANSAVSLEKIREQAVTLTAEITGRGDALVFDPAFLQEIRQAASLYRFENLPEGEASSEIRRAFSTDGGFSNSVIGFVLAASRGLFRTDQTVAGCDVDANGVGLLKVPVTVMNQYGGGGTMTPTVVAAKHLRERINNFEGIDDFIYGIACFGESAERAGSLAQETDREQRRNFWDLVNKKVIKPHEARRVVCFFAAGIVAENPQIFGLNAKSLREVYK